MKLTRLRLFDFRNYETLDLTLDPGVNLILGENAQGKTNLLEAVGYLSTGRSFRTQKTQELIRFGASFADLNADVFSQGRDQNIRAVLFSGRRPRQLYLGGVKQKSAAALPGVLTTVLFCPEDLLVLKGGSQPRRRLLDNALCQLRPSYASALTEYNRLLDSKSRILKDYREKPDLLEPLPEYNYRLAQVGALLGIAAVLGYAPLQPLQLGTDLQCRLYILLKLLPRSLRLGAEACLPGVGLEQLLGALQPLDPSLGRGRGLFPFAYGNELYRAN